MVDSTRPLRTSSKASIRHMRSTRPSASSSMYLVRSEMSVSGIDAEFTRRRMYSTTSDWGPPIHRSTFLASQGRNFFSKIFSSRRKRVSRAILKSASRGSACTWSTNWTRALLSASVGVAMSATPKPSSPLAFLWSTSSFSLVSVSSLARSASSLSRSSLRKRFSATSTRSNSRANSATRHALRFLVLSMRSCSFSRSSWRRWAAAPALSAAPPSWAP
mmetsp:Transcript_131876/g.281982  ORF Transcript_131876/g.281982 Transcript_131876/m.281982 type:complete len:218 (-) Transcript_131876:1237-1890(-)